MRQLTFTPQGESMRGRMAREGIVDSLNLSYLGCFRGPAPQ